MATRKTHEVPRTAGELRKLLKKKGLNWTVDPRLRDNDKLPHYPTGGSVTREKPGRKKQTKQDLKKYLRGYPPMNPFLVNRWRELKLLPGIPREEPKPLEHQHRSKYRAGTV